MRRLSLSSSRRPARGLKAATPETLVVQHVGSGLATTHSPGPSIDVVGTVACPVPARLRGQYDAIRSSHEIGETVLESYAFARSRRITLTPPTPGAAPPGWTSSRLRLLNLYQDILKTFAIPGQLTFRGHSQIPATP